MCNKEFQRRMASNALTILVTLALLTFICRLWPILLLIILGIFVATLRLLFLSVPKAQAAQANPVSPVPSKAADSTPSFREQAYAAILGEITRQLALDFPDAKWVWEKSNSQKLLSSGEDVYILLKNAGGYQRAKVCISGLMCVHLIYETAPAAPSDNDQPEEPEKVVMGEPVQENYELIAFEWVEAHLVELNSQYNEALGLGQTELAIPAGQLPAPESWDAVCKELSRNELHVQRTDDGIVIQIKH